MALILERLQYGFDRDSRRTWRRRALATGEDNAYGYDGLSQVTQAALGDLNQNASAIGAVPAEAEAFDYDPTGNWRGYHVESDGSVTLDQHRIHDKGNRLTQISGDPYPVLLDRAGRMTQVSPDATGDWSDSQQIKWDAWGRITKVSRVSDGAILGNYAYDGLTRRITRTISTGTRHTYYSDQWRPLEERTGTEATAASQYYWGVRHRDDLVRRDCATSDGATLDEIRYVLMDYFSPAAIVDGTGAVTERYRFSAFGQRTILGPDFTPRIDSECAFAFAFQGQFLDSETGLLNYGYRYCNPPLGRWLSKDPLGLSPFFAEYLRRHGKRRKRTMFMESLMPAYQLARNSPPNVTDFLGTEVDWQAAACPEGRLTRFVQVVFPETGDAFVDDGTVGHGGNGLDPLLAGLYPANMNGTILMQSNIFSDNPEGSGRQAIYTVCRVCILPCVTMSSGSSGQISLPPRIECVGPCLTWEGSDAPFDESVNVYLEDIHPTFSSPPANFLATVASKYPNLLPSTVCP